MTSIKKDFNKYEKARILGARALQISMDAPLLLKMKKEELEQLNYDPLKIAEKELSSGVLPITVNQPMPEKREEDLSKIKIDTQKPSDDAKEKVENKEEKEISEDGEIMEIVEEPEETFEEETTSDTEDY